MIHFVKVNKFILSDVSVHIPKGVSMGLIGETGAGKTTFLKLASGLLRPDVGKVYTLGKEVDGHSERVAGSIGVLFAHIPLLESGERVLDNLQKRGTVYQMSREDYWQRYKRLAEILDFEAFGGQKIQNLSMGQRRRVELAAVFLPRPKLLLLDEPTVGLDQKGKDAFHKLVLQREQQGLTTVITSHDMSDISAICSRIAILNQGKICAYGNQELLLKKYAPMDVMQLTLRSGSPDLEDLPIKRYYVEDNRWKLIYNSNYITPAEILRTVLAHCSIEEVSVRKSSLEDVIMEISREKEREYGWSHLLK